MLCIQTNDKFSNPNRMKFDQDDFYLKSAEEMKESWEKAFPELPFKSEMLDNTIKIADSVNFEFPTAKPISFPYDGDKVKLIEDMIAYVDEFGNITSTPPDPSKRKDVDVDQIVIGAASRDELPEDSSFEGKVTFFNADKGYGFIKYNNDRDSVFVHVNNILSPITDNDLVTFEVEQTPKGLSAVKVKKK